MASKMYIIETEAEIDNDDSKFKYHVFIALSLHTMGVLTVFGVFRKEIWKLHLETGCIWAVLGIIGVFLAILILLKFGANFVRRGWSDAAKCQRDLQFGYASIIICAYFPMLALVIFKDFRFYNTYLFICTVTSFMLYCLFILPHLKYYQINRKSMNSTDFLCLGMLIKIAILAVALPLVYNFVGIDFAVIVFFNSIVNFFHLMFVDSEWMALAINGILWEDSENKEKDLEDCTEKPMEPLLSSKSLECNI
ncbi:hypothetical protein CAEBREN_05781 [Caenorhabditis brenneri]|uniref:Uncharacterized protein n=1 Tax=Caenorhabditis brenneri TaxID=135651 RepID=G0PAZ1_CAEBE|nr:hypothetical protein CAEBREN_05781 [Caenorhabditis brenneri]